MNSNLKRKLIAGLFVPIIGVSMGAFAQGSSSGGSGSSGQGSSAGSSSSGQTSTTGGTTGAAQSGSGQGTSGSSAPAMSGSRMMWDAQTFDKLDKNRDGMISREEAAGDQTLLDAWSRLDTGNRGSVSRSDFEKYRSTLSGSSTSGTSAAPK